MYVLCTARCSILIFQFFVYSELTRAGAKKNEDLYEMNYAKMYIYFS